MRYVWVYALGAGWLAAVMFSVVMFQSTAPTDFGLTGGLNRVAVFFGWQLAALILAIVGALVTLSAPRPRGGLVVFTGSAPFAISGVFALGIVGILVWANVSRPPVPATPQTQPPITAPTPAVDAD
jgi:hypothetical protein